MTYFTINQETTPETLKLQYKELAKQLHPDAGGSKEEFQNMQSEYEQALHDLGENEQYKFLLTDTATFKAMLDDADLMLVKLNLKPLNELMTEKAFDIIDKIKLPKSLKMLETLKPIAKMQVAEKLSNTRTLATEVEKFIRKNVKNKTTGGNK